MTKLFGIVLLFACFAIRDVQGQTLSVPAETGSHDQCGVPADQKALQLIADEWRQRYNDGNSAKIAALYAEDAYYLTQHFVTGIVRGRVAIQAYVQLGVDARYHIDSIRLLRADCSGDFAYVITRYDADNAGQKVFGVNLLVLKKSGGRWLIVAHEAAVPDPATAIQHLDTAAAH